ncbi:hypothetical protein L7F22_049501 [Adiantum nelumboides]|nr:hypothetical protein [Adiantum nelumboides]
MILRITNVIKWPSNPEDVQRTKVGMQSAQGLSNCMGGIDCTHVKMERPANELATNWYDRKGNYSMTLQGVVDANMRFLDIFAGFSGPANDKRVLQNSSLFHLAQANQREPCSRSQSRYNYRLSSSRMVVERAFGRLKNAWRILNGVIKNPIVIKVPKIIVVCCMLHNLVINHVMAFDNEMDADLAAYHIDHNIAGSNTDDDAINAETITMYLDEIHGTHM